MLERTRILGLAAAIVLGLAGPAFAHARLASATPAQDGTVAVSPPELDLVFSEDLDLAFTGVKLSGPDGQAVSTGDARLGDGNDAELIVPVSAPLTAGTYTVDWHALSADGHSTNGSYSFTVSP